MPGADALKLLVFDVPPLLRDLILRELRSADLDVTSITAEAGQLERVVAETRPDAVIVPVDSDRAGPESRRFLEGRARTRVLGVGTRDGRSVLYELWPRPSELLNASPEELALMVRLTLAREAMA